MKTTMKSAGRATRAALALILAMGLVGGALAGCAQGTSGNGEIVLTVSKCPTKGLPQELLDEMVKRHPNLRFEFDTYSNGNYSTQQVRQLEQHDIPDVFINTRSQNLTEDLENNLVDLAAYDFTSEYLPSVIDGLGIDGRVYYLPGFLTLAGFFYNKDLFAEHGWDVPRSLEDLVALNEQAAAEGVRLLSYPMGLKGTRFLHLTSIASAKFLHTPEGSVWENGFLAGTATMTGTFEPFMDEYQTWIDGDLITPEQLTQPVNVGKTQFQNGEAAMYYGLSSNVNSSDFDFEVGQAPFLTSGESEESGWYLYSVSAYYGLNKKLEEPGNEEKLAIALEMFEFMSTPEGQEIMKEGGEGRYPATKEAGGEFQAPILGDYADVIDRNNLVQFVQYFAPLTVGGGALGDFIEGDLSAAEALRICDEAQAANKPESEMGDVLGRVERNLSAEETVQCFADAFRDYKGTDLCLMLPGGMSDGELHPYGISGRLYAGDLYANELTALLPYVGSAVPTLATARITGADLRSLLDSGRVFEQEKWTGGELEPFRYAVSGAEAAYGADGRLQTLAVGGRDVADDDVFTVTYFDGAVDGAVLGDVSVSEERPVPAYTAYLQDNPSIS